MYAKFEKYLTNIWPIFVQCCCHTQLHLGFSTKLKIWQVPTCKMDPWSGIILWIVTHQNLMKINTKKTEIMKFNFRTSLDFPPIFTIGDSCPLKIVDHTKILGIILSCDLTGSLQVDYMYKRAMKKVWLIRKLKLLDLDMELILDFYLKEIRSLLEYGAPVWHSGLTRKMSEKIERVQKLCVRALTGPIFQGPNKDSFQVFQYTDIPNFSRLAMQWWGVADYGDGDPWKSGFAT